MEILRTETIGNEVHLTVSAVGIVNIEQRTADEFAAKFGRPVQLHVRYANARDTFLAEPPTHLHGTPQQTALGAVQGSTGEFGIKTRPLRLTFTFRFPYNGEVLTATGDIPIDRELIAKLGSIQLDDVQGFEQDPSNNAATARPAGGQPETAYIDSGAQWL